MHDVATVIQEQVTFVGTAGRIEGVLTYPEQAPPMASMLIVGPHPMLGGDYKNNVVRELATRLAEQNYLTLRFNFRGVGNSDGTTILSTDNIAEFWAKSRIDDEHGFAEDTTAAGHFLSETFGEVGHVLGYSFGAWLGSRWAAASRNLNSITLVAPTISQHDYSHAVELSLPKLVIASSDDFAVPTEGLRQQFSSWSDPKQLVIEDVDNHFFRGHEEWLAENVLTFLEELP